ncbi:MAG: restriction endonuclease [Patescibacteria group bacterium]
MDKKYTEKLEGIIKQMLTPLKEVPFNLVIEGLSGRKIIPFNRKDKKDNILLGKIMKAANLAGKEVNKGGIIRPRPNEVGNDIEPFVKNALNTINYKADTPKTISGSKKSTGYPDIEFVDEFGRINYLECKTFNIENISTTQRSFYLSPSEEFKIIKDAHHFVLSFEIFMERNIRNNKVFKCKSRKILSVENLDVDIKYEFNADNARLYSKGLILAEGAL